ncbi:MAG: hypothetical protein BWY43_00572 [candidate division WS2 bacterium ADurb.Bin280]|uniref:DUF5673 domain-containing protein n=1 Tax=candidate division WS2 bacterium ADurb.Bin280 TaxID=1852829 RepID=A0A1V5SCL5_9BACT|nr:MAG: hypothetical protein BWY43_00572 [candidate division WS2 bacterium ADurb.Bin280]
MAQIKVKKIATKAKKTPSKAKVVKKQDKEKKIVRMLDIAEVIRWKAPDYYTFEKSPFWALSVGAIAILSSLILIYSENYFPVIIIILAVIVTFQVAHEKPKTQEFALDEGGALVRNSYVPYSELKSFWIAKHGAKSILYLEPVSPLKSPIVIPLGEEKGDNIRHHLLRYLPEKLEAGEEFSEKLIRIFRL